MHSTKQLFQAVLFLMTTSSACLVAQVVDLPAPQKNGGKSLMNAIAERATSRDFSANAQDLTPQQLSNLLWAAFGINRPDGQRTAPTAKNVQDITIYVLLKTGTYTYDAAANRLQPVLKNDKPTGDIRTLGGTQDFVKNASVTLIYVSDLSKFQTLTSNRATAREFASIHVGAIAQNASLYCASEGLRGGVRASYSREKLGEALGLGTDQWIVLAQSIGRGN
ncbi:MAG: SagB/ThcOx family dehydrogenase [Puniceicoccales bacterium]|nr:SagB/ThcOx family dehydrogenase [Puniceicoccales bacterium]